MQMKLLSMMAPSENSGVGTLGDATVVLFFVN